MLNVISFLLILFILQVLAMASLQLQLILIKIMKGAKQNRRVITRSGGPSMVPMPSSLGASTLPFPRLESPDAFVK